MPPQANPNKLRELFEFQQRMYAAFNQQQQRQQQQRASSSSQAADSEEAKALQWALENESYAAEIEKMSVQHVNQAQHMRQQKEQQAQQEWRQQQARMAAAAFRNAAQHGFRRRSSTR
ncbi:hypothetical protein M3Y99_00393200 [Aphelenchoides fujianensis]|nr:hypothetical protein M3Y99_00393200 [Aphelenchoides fujianensis]